MSLKTAYENFTTALKAAFKKLEFQTVTTIDGATLEYEGELVKGAVVSVVTEEGSSPAEGEFSLSDGSVLVINGGVLAEIKVVEEGKGMQKHAAEVAAADGSLLMVDPALEVGASVMVATPEGSVAAPDGAIELSTGQVIEVVDGKIESISTIEGMKKRQTATNSADDVRAKIEVQRTEIERRFAAMEGALENMSSVLGQVVESLDKQPVTPVKKEEFAQVQKPEFAHQFTADSFRKMIKK